MSRYLGNKEALKGFITEIIFSQTESIHSGLDVFAGLGTVAKEMKAHGMSVMANDRQYYSFVQTKTLMEMNHPISTEMRERIEFLNSDALMANPPCRIEDAFIYQNYSPHDGCERKYFTTSNAVLIDYIRHQIEQWRGAELQENEYYYLLSLLLDGASKVANTAGTFGAYLKEWDGNSLKPLILTEREVIYGESQCMAYCMDAYDFATKMSADVAYLDPPYCNREYGQYYHVLETIARYDYPEIRGVTGQRVKSNGNSDFCSKRKAKEAFRQLLGALDVRYVFLSYNDDKTSILTTEEMTGVVCECGNPKTFKLFEMPYRRYKSNQNGETKTVNEQIYFIEK